MSVSTLDLRDWKNPEILSSPSMSMCKLLIVTALLDRAPDGAPVLRDAIQDPIWNPQVTNASSSRRYRRHVVPLKINSCHVPGHRGHAKQSRPELLLRRRLCRAIHTKVSRLNFPDILEQKAALEVGVRVQDGVQFARWPERLFLHLQAC